MEAIPFISVLIVVFVFVLLGEQIRLKKEVRKVSRLTNQLKVEIEKIKGFNK
jgi:hypothetical protein